MSGCRPSEKIISTIQIRGFPVITGNILCDALYRIAEAGTPVSAWDKQLEKATPYYFSTWLEDYDITAEFSPGKKSGFFRFTFPDKEQQSTYSLMLTESDRISLHRYCRTNYRKISQRD
ncbi:MAG: hypothetical protein MZV63_10020 [Marinilabiliales bacterium]|nr:hypothetical protein [Marinilabiliales bacterium]